MRAASRGTRSASALVHVLLLAFLLQIVATRGHFHFGNTAAADIVAAQEFGDNPPAPDKQPTGHQESDCPLWHASVVCGIAVHATAVKVIAPLSQSARAPIDQRAIVPERFTAAWRSRAPPIV